MMKALLVVDVQAGYIEKYPPALLKCINARIEKAVSDKELIVYIKNTKTLRRGKYTNDFATGLSICSELIICKEKADAFSNDELHKLLTQKQITTVELVGIDGNSCIAKTAISAISYGYDTILQSDCVGVQNAERFITTKKMLSEKGVLITD